ncbi:hypothetical protein TNCV_5096151 [Trichonephila clavipes]|nr:hypothetical protein TNCV_5096151 [Trichonephila clavipes]
MVLKATANDRRHLALCRDEFRGPRSGLCQSGGISNNNTSNISLLNSIHCYSMEGGAIKIMNENWVASIERLRNTAFTSQPASSAQKADSVEMIVGALSPSGL